MKKRAVTVVLAVGFIAVAAGVASLAWSFFKPTAEASGPIEAIAVEVLETPSAETSQAGEPGQETAEVPPSAPSPGETAAAEVASSEVDAPTEAPASRESVAAQPPDTSAEPSAPSEPAASTEASEVAADAAPAPAPVPTRVFETLPGRTEARFLIDEVLRGEPVTVVGSTDQVAAQFAVKGDDLGSLKIGPVLVNARTLATDNEYRNRAVRNKILHTDDHEYVQFTPTGTEGLPDVVTVGETFAFRVRGNLAVAGTTRPVTFVGEGRFVSADRVEATLATTISHADFGLDIPSPPIVAGVADDVRLELTFVADELSTRGDTLSY